MEYEGYAVCLAHDGEEAVTKIQDVQPDLIVLDVMMPKKSGWEVLSFLNEEPDKKNVRVIIVSAKRDENAKLLGFRLGADDYMTKPFSMKELCARVARNLSRKVDAEKTQNNDSSLNRIPVFKGNEIILIEQRDIVYINAVKNYSFIHTLEDKFLCRMKLYEIEEKLAKTLIRIHRGYIVNLWYVKKFFSSSNYAYKLIVNNQEETELPVSKRHVKEVKDWMKLSL